jgi:ketosteroid isomerase-like protein
VSQENVEIVRALHPPPDMDLAVAFRDERSWSAFAARLGPTLTKDFECVTHGFPGSDGEISEGIEGLRATFLEWIEPWESYRTEVEEAMDLGDSVLVLVRDFGRRAQQTAEVSVRTGAVWTVRDGKVRRIEFCADRLTALKAAGLED